MFSVITQHLPLKIASLFIALILAYAVHSAGNASVVSLYVPVEIKNIPDDKVVVSPTKRSVQITIRGPSFLIGPIASSPPSLRARLPDEVRDRAIVNFQPIDLNLPRSIEVLSIEPSRMELGLETVEQYEVPVKVMSSGHLSSGLVLEGIEVSPKKVLVRGPRSEVKKVRLIETESLDLSSLASSDEVVLKLRNANPKVVSSANTVVARIRIGNPQTERSFEALAVEVRSRGGESGVRIEPKSVSVALSGPPGVVAELDEKAIVPYVRIATRPPSPSEVAVSVDVPEGVKVVKVSPARVRISSLSGND